MRPWRKATASLATAAAASGHVAVFTQAPDLLQPVAHWAISVTWVAVIELTMHPIRAHLTQSARHGSGDVSINTLVQRGIRAPSARMRTAHLIARADSSTDLVAHIGQVPHALAELIVADARRSNEHPR